MKDNNLKQRSVYISILLFLCILFSPVQENLTLEQLQISVIPCPEAKPVSSVTISGQTVQAPRSPVEEQTLLSVLSHADTDEAGYAIVSLALTGSLEAFEKILDMKDPVLLRHYVRHYQNRDGSTCLDPVIEDAVIEHFNDPGMRKIFIIFFRKNIYQSKRLFNLLIGHVPDLELPDPGGHLVKALVATNLDDIEQQVLEYAVNLNARVDQKHWWFFPQIEKQYFDFFVQRQYEPVLPFMRLILDEVHYSTVKGSFKTHIINRHRYIYSALDAFSSPRTADIFIRQLSKLPGTTRDSFFVNEFNAGGEYAVKHAVTDEQKKQVTHYLIQILDSVLPDREPADRIIHGKAIELLGKTGTRISGERLLTELKRLIDIAEKRYSASAIVKILLSLDGIPKDAEINIPEFLRLAVRLDKRSRFFHVPTILVKHQHPEGHAFLLSALEQLITSDEDLRRVLGFDNERAFNIALDHVLQFRDEVYLNITRDWIDVLFRDNKLSEKLFVSTSEYLNEIMESRSPAYQEVIRERETLKEAERRQRADEKQAQWKQKLESMFAQQTLPEGIKKNILALNRANSGISAKWLIVAGKDILPYAHEILLDPEVSIRIKYRLIDVLGAIGDPRSIDPIIEVTRAHPEGGLYKAAFLTLGQMQQTPDSVAFAAEQLQQEQLPRIQRSALVYFAVHRDIRALTWAEQYSGPGTIPEVRIAGLYLLARLGETKAIHPLLDLLNQGQNRLQEETLLRALAELTTPEGFRSQLAKISIDRRGRGYKTALHIAEFRHGTGDVRIAAAEQLFHSPYVMDKREAVRYLIQQNQVEVLGKYIPPDPSFSLLPEMAAVYSESPISILVVIEARRMGLKIERTPDGIRFVVGKPAMIKDGKE